MQSRWFLMFPAPKRFPLLAMVLGLWVAVAGAEETGLSEARFEELRAALVPAPDEPWQSIPWKVALLEAQREAARTRQLIFIWAMDGHPLGCT